MNPLISICIPTYNGQEFIKQCLNSCIHQSFLNYEIIICDDGSTDKTIEIIEEYASTYPIIKFHKNTHNLGLVDNWNKCIDMSTGEWIKFVFQDDYITPHCLQEFSKVINESAHLIVCKRHFILPENPTNDYVNYYTHVVRTLENTGYTNNTHFSPKQIADISIRNMCMNFIGEPSLAFFKKNTVTELGYFNNTLKQICDLEFLLRIASIKGLTYIPQQLCAFRIHYNSTTAKNVEENKYILSYIEPLLFSHILLFDSNYTHFRKNLSLFQQLKLHIYFRVKAYKAYKINSSGNYNHPLFKNEKEYPEIQKAKTGNIIIKLLSYYF